MGHRASTPQSPTTTCCRTGHAPSRGWPQRGAAQSCATGRCCNGVDKLCLPTSRGFMWSDRVRRKTVTGGDSTCAASTIWVTSCVATRSHCPPKRCRPPPPPVGATDGKSGLNALCRLHRSSSTGAAQTGSPIATCDTVLSGRWRRIVDNGSQFWALNERRNKRQHVPPALPPAQCTWAARSTQLRHGRLRQVPWAALPTHE